MVYFVQNVQKYRRYEEFEIYVEILTGTTISQEMLKQTVNKNNIHVPVGVSQVSQLVAMILLINDCYVMSLVVIILRMNFVLYRNTPPPLEKESYIKNTKFISSPVSEKLVVVQFFVSLSSSFGIKTTNLFTARSTVTKPLPWYSLTASPGFGFLYCT